LRDIERLIRQSITAEDRRSSAGRFDNRFAHPRSAGHDTRGAAIHPGHDRKTPARGRSPKSSRHGPPP
jgi:hypothetical protein